MGAALCIAAIVRNSDEQDVASQLTKLVQKLQKHLNSPSCLAKAAIYVLISSLVEVKRSNYLQIEILRPSNTKLFLTFQRYFLC